MCPLCQSKYSIKRGCDDRALARQRSTWTACDTRFDPIFPTPHVSLRHCEVSRPAPLPRCRRCDRCIALPSRHRRHCTARSSYIIEACGWHVGRTRCGRRHRPSHAPKPERAMSHTLSRVKSRGGVASLRSVTVRIACKDTSRFETFSCPWTSSSAFYKLLEIERTL